MFFFGLLFLTAALVSITPAQIEFYTNESAELYCRLNGTDGQTCQNSSILIWNGTAASNPFNQSLNNTDAVQFADVKIGTDSDSGYGEALTVSHADYGIYAYCSAADFATYCDGEGYWLGTTTNDPLRIYVNDGGTHTVFNLDGTVDIGGNEVCHAGNSVCDPADVWINSSGDTVPGLINFTNETTEFNGWVLTANSTEFSISPP